MKNLMCGCLFCPISGHPSVHEFTNTIIKSFFRNTIFISGTKFGKKNSYDFNKNSEFCVDFENIW